jgi:hypothetical protein
MLFATFLPRSPSQKRSMLKPFFQATRALFGGQDKGPPRCIAVCIDHQTRMWRGIGNDDIDFLVERLRTALSSEAVDYDGQDDIDGETRLYFFTSTPDRILPVVLAQLGEIPRCRGSRVLMQSKRFGAWDTHLL